MRYHFIPIRIALCSVDGNVKWYRSYEKQYAALKKIKNKITIWSSNPIHGYISKRVESRISKRFLTIHIHNSQKVEANLVFIN